MGAIGKRLRTNLMLVAIVVALGAIIWLAPESRREPQGVPLFGADEVISRVEVFMSGESRLALQKQGDDWTLVVPFELPADDFQVDVLLDALRMSAVRRYAATELKPGDSGLEDAEWTMRVNGMELILGGSTVIGHNRYLRKGDHVYLVTELLGYQLQRDPLDYAGKHLLPRAAEMKAIQLPSGQRIERAGNGWRITPDAENVPADRLQAVVDAWENAAAFTLMRAASVPRDGEVAIEFANGEVLRFGVEIRDKELRLSRAEPEITYLLPLSAADELLQASAEHPANQTPE